MKKLHLLRVAAVGVTAAALTVSGASMAAAEPAVAQGTDRAGTTAASAGEVAEIGRLSRGGVTIQSNISTFRVSSGVLARKYDNPIKASIALNLTKPPASITTAVTVNGTARGSVPLPYSNLVLLPSSIGPGKVVLGPTTIRYTDNTTQVIPTRSNSFYFRRDTFGAFKVRHRGKKVSMSMRAQIRNNDGSRASAGRAYVQYAKNGRWKHLKRVRLNSSGKASYKYSTRSKRTYRLVVKRTTKIDGMTIRLRKL